MDQEEEKKDTARDVNPAILEAFDGDLDEWLEWNRQSEEFKEQVKEEAEEDDGIERQLTADGKSVEWFNIRADQMISSDPVSEVPAAAKSEEEVWTRDSQSVQPDPMAAGHLQEIRPTTEKLTTAPTAEYKTQASSLLRAETERLIADASSRIYQGQPGILSDDGKHADIHPIDITDPHYVNYKPDPYYEYGIGPEPKRPRGRIGGPAGMSIASMCCGIGSLMLIFCGYGIPLSIVALVLGIISLNRKQNTTGGKAMSIVGISLASVSIIGMIIWFVYVIMDM